MFIFFLWKHDPSAVSYRAYSGIYGDALKNIVLVDTLR